MVPRAFKGPRQPHGCQPKASSPLGCALSSPVQTWFLPLAGFLPKSPATAANDLQSPIFNCLVPSQRKHLTTNNSLSSSNLPHVKCTPGFLPDLFIHCALCETSQHTHLPSLGLGELNTPKQKSLSSQDPLSQQAVVPFQRRPWHWLGLAWLGLAS